MGKNDCPDCGVKKGEHHIVGCDIERCPICKLQLITCDCTDKELEDYEKKHGWPKWDGDIDKIW